MQSNPNRRHNAAVLAANALKDNTAYSYIYQGLSEEAKLEELIWFFERNFGVYENKCPHSLRFFHATSDSKEDQEKLQCFYMLVPSSEENISFWDIITSGLFLFPFRLGWERYKVIMHLNDWQESLTKSIMKDRPHYKLCRMVVDPVWQGKGIGSRCLLEGCQQADREQLPIYLDTQKIENVRFYSKLGFTLIKEIDFLDANNNFVFKSWAMVREPQQPAQTST